MRILHICLCGGWYAGNAYQDQLLPRYHRKAGHEVVIVASIFGRWNLNKNFYDIDDNKVTLLPDGIQLIRLRPLLPQRWSRHFHMFCGLGKAIKKIKPDFIFVHDVESPDYLSVAKYKRKHPEVKIVCDNHADFYNSPQHLTKILWSKLIIRNIVVRKLIPVSEWFYGTTPARCEFLVKMFGVPKSKVKLLVMGSDDEKMNFEQKETIRSKIRKRHSISDSDFLLVTGGRIDLAKSKRFIELAEAVTELNKMKLKLIIFGPIADDSKKLFNKFSKEQILLIGPIPSDKVYDYFYAADLVVFPGLHSAMWEQAVASQVACMFHRLKGFEHVDIGGNCIWIEEDSVVHYKYLLKKVVNNCDLYQEIKKNAESDMSKQFLYSNISKKVLNDVFKNSINE